MFKRFTCIILITIAIAVPFLGQLNFNEVYAADNTESINRNELVDAFKAYCKSRDLSVEGTGFDALDNFTSSTMDSITKLLGIDLTQLQAEINKVVDPNSNTFKYYTFTALGITGFNRIFAQFLQDNDLAVGDENVDKTVKSGKWFTDAAGNGCWIYIQLGNSTSAAIQKYDINELFSAVGSPYIFNASYVESIYPNSEDQIVHLTEDAYATIHFTSNPSFSSSKHSVKMMVNNLPANRNIVVFNNSNNSVVNYGYPIICLINGNLWLCSYDLDTSIGRHTLQKFLQFTGTATDEIIKVTSPVIKPALPEDPCNIAPDGNVTPTDQDPTEPPPDPTGGTPPDWSMDTDVEPDGDGWKIPFSLPDLDIDWKIEGLSKKFPFCIPKDIVQVVNVLNVPAQAPKFTGSVDLLVYEWDVDIDFSDFDTLSVILRNGIFILFCVGLLVITRTIIRG